MLSDTNIVDVFRDFSLLRQEAIYVIVNMDEYNWDSKGIFGQICFKTYWMTYENVERIAGKIKWSFWKLFKYAAEAIINFF